MRGENAAIIKKNSEKFVPFMCWESAILINFPLDNSSIYATMHCAKC